MLKNQKIFSKLLENPLFDVLFDLVLDSFLEGGVGNRFHIISSYIWF